MLTPVAVPWHAAGIFSVEIVTRFCTGIVISNRMRRALIMDRRIVALHYVLHGPFLLDLAVTATLWAEVQLRLNGFSQTPYQTCAISRQMLCCMRRLTDSMRRSLTAASMHAGGPGGGIPRPPPQPHWAHCAAGAAVLAAPAALAHRPGADYHTSQGLTG